MTEPRIRYSEIFTRSETIYTITLAPPTAVTAETSLPENVQTALKEGGTMKIHKCIGARWCKPIMKACTIASKKIRSTQCISIVVQLFANQLMGRNLCLQTSLEQSFVFVFIVDKSSVQSQTDTLLRLFERPAHSHISSLNDQLAKPYDPESYVEYRASLPATQYCFASSDKSIAGTIIFGSLKKLSGLARVCNETSSSTVVDEEHFVGSEKIVFPVPLTDLIKLAKDNNSSIGYDLSEMLKQLKTLEPSANNGRKKKSRKARECTGDWDDDPVESFAAPVQEVKSPFGDKQDVHILVGISRWTITPKQNAGIVLDGDTIKVDLEKVFPLYAGKVGLVENACGKVEVLIKSLPCPSPIRVLTETTEQTAIRETFEEMGIVIDTTTNPSAFGQSISIADSKGVLYAIDVTDAEIISDKTNKLVCLKM